MLDQRTRRISGARSGLDDQTKKGDLTPLIRLRPFEWNDWSIPLLNRDYHR